VIVPLGDSGAPAHATIVVLSMLKDRLDDIATSCHRLTRLASADPQPRASNVSDSWRVLGDAVADLAAHCDRLQETAVELGNHTTAVERITDASTFYTEGEHP
jgi:hypothetical protein